VYVSAAKRVVQISLISSLSFAEYRLFYRALLQKRPVILRSLLIVATPYVSAAKEIVEIPLISSLSFAELSELCKQTLCQQILCKYI